MVQALLAIAIHHYVADSISHPSFEPVGQSTVVLRTLGQLFTGEFCSFTKRDNSGSVFSACAAFAFLMSTDVLHVHSHAATNVERADAFRRIQFVPGHR